MNETYEVAQWEAGTEPTRTTAGIVGSGQNIAQYAPLGMLTASGKLVIWDAAGNNGSENAVFLAPLAIDASAQDTPSQLIKTGCFNIDLVAWPGTPTAAEKALAFAGTPISLQTLGS